MRGLSQGQSPARDSFISLRGHYWERETVVHDFHHLSNQQPIREKILGARRKLVIVISHLSPTRHRDAEMYFLGCAKGASKIKGQFVYFGSHLESWDGCRVYGYAPALLPAYFSGVYFISGQKWHSFAFFWTSVGMHPWAILGTFLRSVTWCKASCTSYQRFPVCLLIWYRWGREWLMRNKFYEKNLGQWSSTESGQFSICIRKWEQAASMVIGAWPML